MKEFFILLTIFIVSFLVGSIIIRVAFKNHDVDLQTKLVCQQMSIENKYNYRNTEFKDMDFYKSCIDNVLYTSPLNR